METFEKKYNEALGWMRKIYSTLNGSDKEDAEHYFPELKESEDERIRKELLKEIEFIIPRDGETDGEGLILPSYHARIDRYKSYLEKQKEQQPAEWSEEDKRAIDRACVALRAYSNGDLPNFLPSELLGYADRLQSLRPQPHWKPSEEQMKALKLAYEDAFDCPEGGVPHLPLQSLYQDLQKLL